MLTLVPVSKNLLSGVAGALFGLAGGIAISWVASMLSALVGFAIARRLGREAVAELTGPRIDKAEEIMRQQGVAAVIVARLTPVLPFTIVNYGAGVSAVSLRDFLVGTAVGIVPGTVGYAALGASAGRSAADRRRLAGGRRRAVRRLDRRGTADGAPLRRLSGAARPTVDLSRPGGWPRTAGPGRPAPAPHAAGPRPRRS